MRTTYATRTRNDERLEIKLPAEQKRRTFEFAAERGLSVGHLVRMGIAHITRAASNNSEFDRG